MRNPAGSSNRMLRLKRQPAGVSGEVGEGRTEQGTGRGLGKRGPIGGGIVAATNRRGCMVNGNDNLDVMRVTAWAIRIEV